MAKSSPNVIAATLFKRWDIFVSALGAALAYLWLDPERLKDVAGDMVVYFGIQAAAILPAMIFAASILRPDGLSLDDVTRYRKALRRQMNFWVALLVIDLAASIVMICGKGARWEISAPVRWLASDRPYAPGFVALAAFVSLLAILRLFSFATGMFSLLELNGELTEKAVKARLRAELRSHSTGPPEATTFQTPPGYGQITPPH